MLKKVDCIILDTGHGGLICGDYQTPGKRSPKWDKGLLYEGVFNRKIGWDLKWEMYRNGIKYYDVSAEDRDVSLSTRVNRANRFYRERDGNMLFLSIHANAGGGRGVEIYTSRGETMSDKYAEVFADTYLEIFDDEPLRTDLSDLDKDKEANFYVLKNTVMPAILIEAPFMDNYSDYIKLLDERFHKKYIDWVIKSLKKIT